MMPTTETITLGCGCFWCFEAIMQRVQGVLTVTPGYAGGYSDTPPTYEQVCTGKTGYAEVLNLDFNSAILSLETLLKVFFSSHDPTTLNRQGADIGSQYRSIIFYRSAEQKQIASQLISELNQEKHWLDPIVTIVCPFELFYPAETYHHDYYNQHTQQAYCRAVILPKLNNLAQQHQALVKNNA